MPSGAGAGLAEQPALLSGPSLPWEQSQLGGHVRAGLLLQNRLLCTPSLGSPCWAPSSTPFPKQG